MNCGPPKPGRAPFRDRAASHLEVAGRAAHDRGDAVAAMNLLIRAAALLPRDDAALARLYTSVGTAMTEAGQLEKAAAALADARRIADLHVTTQARPRPGSDALPGPETGPEYGAVQIVETLPELRAEFTRDSDELGLCRTLQLQAAMHWIQANRRCGGGLATGSRIRPAGQ